MAFVHDQSCECVKSELDLFAVPPTQTSIESASYVEYNPISTISDGIPIEFIVSGSGNDYIDLANTQLYVTAQILNDDNTNIANDASVAPVNLFLQSLFSEIDIKINDTLITSTNNTYPYRAYLETLLSYGDEAKNSQLTSAMFYRDTAGHMDAHNSAADNCRNAGLVKRREYFRTSRLVDMVGRLHCDLFFQEKYLPSGMDIKMRFVRSKDAFCLMAADDGFKVRIRECKLLVRRVKLSPSVFVAHGKALEVGNAKYPVRRVICKSFTIPRGNLDFSQENLFTGQIPTRLVLCCVDNTAFNGSYKENPFNFKHFNLSQLKIYIDGQQHQVRPLELNFDQQKYILAYQSLFSGTGKQYKDEGNLIQRDEFPGGFAIYCFDLTPDMAEGDHFNLIKEGSVRVDMKFADALPNTINVVTYCEFENILEVDSMRNVLFDYST